jgi:hypothetical protein
MTLRNKISNLFFKEVNIAPLAGFRIIFGALMLFGVLRFISKGWVYDLYIQPDFHFTYLGFDWIRPLPNDWMYLPFILMVLGATGILLGLFYRWSAFVYFVCFTYVELIDKSYYLNHYYFVSLVAFWMIFLPANRDFSLDVKRNPHLYAEKVSSWTIWIIQVQLGIVYVFAGIAKLHYDWLIQAQPLKIWLQAYRDLSVIGWLFASPILAYFFSWFGCIYDLTIPFFLRKQATRNYAYFFVVVFHVVTWLLFPIGVFPWVMIFSTLIFFPASFHERYLQRLKVFLGWVKPVNQYYQGHKRFLTVSIIAIYLLFQLLIPFRYLLYPANLFWHEEGFRFSWRVMLMHKEGSATFYVKDKKTNGTIEIENCAYLTPVQIDQMTTQPDMILQFAQHLKSKFNDTILSYSNQQVHLKNPAVNAEVFVSLNGRPSQLFIDKKHDLSLLSYNLANRKWLEAFHETY